MTAIHPDALLAAMPNLDAHVACEYEDGCDRPAVWRVAAHGRRRPGETCKDHVLLICNADLVELRQKVDALLSDCAWFQCVDCGTKFYKPSDVIQSVVAL